MEVGAGWVKVALARRKKWAGKPLSFSTAIRGPHGREWTLADEQELIKLLVASSL